MASRSKVIEYAYLLTTQEFISQYKEIKESGVLEPIFDRFGFDWHETLLVYWQENLTDYKIENLINEIKEKKYKDLNSTTKDNAKYLGIDKDELINLHTNLLNQNKEKEKQEYQEKIINIFDENVII